MSICRKCTIAFLLTVAVWEKAMHSIVLSSAFQIGGSPPIRRLPSTSGHSRRYETATTMKSLLETDESDFSESSRDTQLWLDLRNTAVVPRMALSRLIMTEEGATTFTVDRVVISEEDVSRATQSWEEGDPDMLFVRERDGKLCDVTENSRSYGYTFAIDAHGSSYVDPTPAIDTASSGGWVLIDREEHVQDNGAREEAVSSLVSLLVGVLPSAHGSLQLESGLLLGEPPVGRDSDEFANDGMGGVAVACRTNDNVMKTAATLQLLRPGGILATDSGILLRLSETGCDDDAGDEHHSGLLSALVLPFDPSLWETAAFVLGEITI